MEYSNVCMELVSYYCFYKCERIFFFSVKLIGLLVYPFYVSNRD